MTRRIALPYVLGGCLLFALLAATPAAASPSPAEWKLTVTPNADYFLSGSVKHPGVYKIEAENIGESPTSESEPIKIEDIPPVGTSVEQAKVYITPGPGLGRFDLHEFNCPSAVECEYPGPLLSFFGFKTVKPGERLIMYVLVQVPSNVEGPLEDVAKISGGGATAIEASTTNVASLNPPFGKVSFDASLTDSSGNPYTQAGGHPYEFRTEFNFGTFSNVNPNGGAWDTDGTSPVRDPKSITEDLPPGLLTNPQDVPHCSLADYFANSCAVKKVAVGEAGINFFAHSEPAFSVIVPILNLQPEGAYPAELGITIAGGPFIIITTAIRSGGDYGATAVNVAGQADLFRVRLNLWGVPADEGHNGFRGKNCEGPFYKGREFFSSAAMMEQDCENEEIVGAGGPAEVPETAYLTMPTECSDDPLTIVGRYDTWQVPGEYAKDSTTFPAVDGCNNLSFEPTIEARPTTDLADAPSGLEFNLHVPQNEDPEGVATPELKESVVKLPKGLSINPASGDGLGSCSEAQIGLHTEEPAHCPDASKLGTAEVKTPLLHEPLTGFLYLATPHQNPSGSLLAGYLVVEGQGIKIKLPGRFETNQQTGQITVKFLQNPQLPFEDLKLDLFGGARGALRTPATCGTYETTSSLTPFSAPESGPPATPSGNFETTTPENGGTCPTSAGQLPNAPRFIAGTETPQAGIYSPFSLKLVREDGSQEITSLETTLPKGLIGKLAGIPYCPESGIAQARSREHEGGGAEEKSSPSCPASSEVGTVDVGSGAGPTPINVPGHVYLSGPYKGAPISLTIITPALAGPFDLGTVVVRTALYVNPETTQIHAVSDPIPTILQGIPLDVRSITLKMARPKFTLNPTSCEESTFTGSALSVLGVSAPLNQRFQVGGCKALAFKPKLALRVSGSTKRAGNPALTATLTYPGGPGYANLAATQVTLPNTELLDNAHIRNPCTRVQFAANACPASSVIGFARAETSLLEKPLEGPVYLRSSSHKLPDIVAALNGQIDIELDGRIDSVHRRLRTTFETIPDAPVSRFTLSLYGAKKGLLSNSANLCSFPQRINVKMRGQNGKTTNKNPLLATPCRQKKAKRHSKSHANPNRKASR